MLVRTVTGFASVTDDLSGSEKRLNQIADQLTEGGFTPQTRRLTTNAVEKCRDIRDLGKKLALMSDFADTSSLDLIHLGALAVDNQIIASAEARDLLVDFLTEHKKFNLAVDLGDTYPVDFERCRAAAELCLALSSYDAFDCFNFATCAYITSSTPFYPASRVLTNAGCYAIGAQSSDLLLEVLQNPDQTSLIDRLKQALTQGYESLYALFPHDQSDFLGFDTSMAPFPSDQYSIANLLEKISKVRFGEMGTLAACRMLTYVMKNIPVVTTGLCGLMLPPLEDHILARRAAEGLYTVKDLMLFSTVCATGIDTVVVSAGEGAQRIARLYYDVATLAVTLRKPLSVRLMVVPDKKTGDLVRFSSDFVCDCPVMSI